MRPDQPPNIDQVTERRKKPQHKEKPKVHTCTRCDRTPPHSRQECPARDVTCYKCSKKGHFSTFCHSTGLMHTVEISDHEQDFTDNFLGAIQTNNSAKPTSPLTVLIAINGTVVTFKIDTRVDVTGIPETVFKQIKNTTLQPCSRALKGPCQNSLKVIGQFQGTLTYESKAVQQAFLCYKIYTKL